MSDNIDAVILFVDMNDSEWRQKYNDYVVEHEIPNKHINNEERFRDYGSLLGVLRSIDMYAPWINNVFLVVQSESQVPKWVNRDTVKIVLHEEFIPREYLPTFNCNTIETHLHFIPGLSEKFIYFNDDTLLNDVNYIEDYFIGDKCVCYMNKINREKLFNIKTPTFYNIIRHNNIEKINSFFPIATLKDYTFYNSHGPTPLLKKICEEVYNKITISDTISALREKNNLTQELFTVYALLKRRMVLLKNSKNHNTSSSMGSATIFKSENMIKIQRYFFFSDYYSKQFCVNDNFKNEKIDNDLILLNDIKKQLNKKFPNKCKYEKK